MGGNKSKPVVESARVVMAKRGLDVSGLMKPNSEARAVSDSLNMTKPDYVKPVFNYGNIGKVDEMDPKILETISKWDVVHVKKKEQQVEVLS
jgi:hypothetical protein